MSQGLLIRDKVCKPTLQAIIQLFKDDMDENEHFCTGCGKDISCYEEHHIHPNCPLSAATQELIKLEKELVK